MIILVAYLCLGFLTAGYCAAVWYGSGLWSIFYPSTQDLPALALYTIAPLPLSAEYAVAHFQGAAVLSLLVSVFWGYRRSVVQGAEGFSIPISMHLSVILALVTWNIAGAISPMVWLTAKLVTP